MRHTNTPTAARGLASFPWRERLAWAAPWGASALLHGAIIISAFFVVWSVALPPPPGIPIVASFDDPGPAGVGALDLRAPDRDQKARDRPAEPKPAALPLPPDTPTLSELVSRLAPAPVAQSPDESELAERRALIAERRLPEVRFAGHGASNASKIVYVVDASGSMVSTLPVVLQELSRSVRRLAPVQQFQIIFFGVKEHEPAPHPADPPGALKTARLVRATRENVEAVLLWAGRNSPGGRSNPVPALTYALKFQPDVIFLLSNVITGLGVWEPDKAGILAQVDALNPRDRTGRRRTLIKTVQFLDEDPAGILQAIGAAHGGDQGYKFLSRGDLGLEDREPPRKGATSP